MQAARIGEIVDQGIERASETHEQARQGEREPDLALHRDAEKARAALILTDRNHRAAERRAQDEAHDADGEGEADQHEIVERVGVGENVDLEGAEIQRLAREAAQPVVAAGDRAPLEGDVVEDLPEGDRHHGEVDAAPADDQCAQERAGNAAEQHATKKRQRRRWRQEFERKPGAIGAEPEIGGVAEGQDACEAEQKIHRHRGQREHQDARPERSVSPKRRHPVGRQDEDRPDRRKHGKSAPIKPAPVQPAPVLTRPLAAHVIIPSSPRRPRGRSNRITAMSTYMIASLAAGAKTAVTPEATPISNPPMSVPGRLPTPPTMMAMKLGIRSPVPMVGSRPSCPAASTPLNPARKMPTAKLSERSMRTLMPMAATVSRSRVPARMRIPRRV